MTKQFLLLFTGTFFISLFVLMMQFLWRYVDDLIGKGLSIDILGQFFWYMSLSLVPQALPLAVLLSSLITMGNIGESSELTAIKAAGISLVQALRSMFFCALLVSCCSFYFQNVIGPRANRNMAQLLLSMKQKSPELEIPEGIFYDGIPNCNLYVQKKNLETGMLYGLMIYRITNSYEDAAIILADSGMLQSTADKQHLLLTLHSGEWFENMRSQEFSQNANVPYRRETFVSKRILLDFDDGFNLADAGGIASKAQAKSLDMIMHSIDSLTLAGDSVGRELMKDMQRVNMISMNLSKEDSTLAVKNAIAGKVNMDSLLQNLTPDKRRTALQRGSSKVQMASSTMDFYRLVSADNDRSVREHWIEAVNKFTLSLTCLIFFFIGASLGAIIRKGGLGVPVIISVLVFILFYTLDNTGYRMARLGTWPIWFGKGLAPAVLIPMAAFVTYKANNDSTVFNWDMYTNMFRKLFGLRVKRTVMAKEVIIVDPQYQYDAQQLEQITLDVRAYESAHHLGRLPNIVNVFFRYQPDHEIKRISGQLEDVIEDLSNTRDRYVLDYLNRYPVVSEKAHTRPFERKWMNVTAFCLLPVGMFLYIRMWRFRLRLLRDLRQIVATNELLCAHIYNKV